MNFDAIVVGGGHAGIEATRALARAGLSVALVTLDSAKIGAMSCNPAIGGVAKSHLVFEIDALGGWMGAAADANGIQARRLNLSKGPAVRSTRVQCDKDRYSATMVSWIKSLEGVTVISGEAAKVNFARNKVSGLFLKDGTHLESRAVLITAGTFMRGLMFCGDEQSSGGRFGDSAAEELSGSLNLAGHVLSRLKTGTPARLVANSIDFSKALPQWGDPEQRYFSWRRPQSRLPQISCYMVHTSERTHDVIRRNFHRSPLFSGEIQGVGPRYCPSVEDKIKRFPERTRHQIFLEPEGLNCLSIYPNGLSTSLPADVQLEFLKTIDGLEDVDLLRPGYAVEYDTIDPTSLNRGLASRNVEGLFFAGQVNRTSGYEEAAAQGLWAGMNAARFCRGQEFLYPDRGRSYIETLVDDLTTKGTDEPYRMFTSRSEYRLHLREDNAQERLAALGNELGLRCSEQQRSFLRLKEESAALKQKLLERRVALGKDRNPTLFDYLKRPEVSWELLAADVNLAGSDRALEAIEIDAKYSGYLGKQNSELNEMEAIRSWRLDPGVNLEHLPSLSREVIEKYRQRRPTSVLELCAISGITPAAVLSIAKAAGLRPKPDVSRETVSE